MIFFEDKTLCDCGELLFDGINNYLISQGDGNLRCSKCYKIYTRKEVEF